MIRSNINHPCFDTIRDTDLSFMEVGADRHLDDLVADQIDFIDRGLRSPSHSVHQYSLFQDARGISHAA